MRPNTPTPLTLATAALLAFVAASLVLIVGVLASTAGTATATNPPGSLTMGPQAMEGNLIVAPGTVLLAGYDLTIPGSHPATNVETVNPQVVFDAHCVSGGGEVTLTVQMPTAVYAIPANDSAWFPSGDQSSPLVYEGETVVPDACSGGDLSLASGGTFSTVVFSVPVPGDGVHVRWHYSANGSSGSWSETAHVQPAPGE